jgi:hypothetical protein
MRTGVPVLVSTRDRRAPGGRPCDRNTAQKHVSGARIILLKAGGLGTMALWKGRGKSKTIVWRRQERYAEATLGHPVLPSSR